MSSNSETKLPPLNHFSSGYASKLTGVSVKELAQLEKSTSLLNRGRGRNAGLYTRKSIENLISYVVIARQRAVSILAAWRTDNPASVTGADKNRAASRSKTAAGRIDLQFYTSALSIARAANVDISTARRYRRTGKAPQAVAAILDLRARGRIMPESWNHCFFNYNEKLEHFGVGEVNESEVLTINWARSLHQQHVAALEKDLKQALSRIECLDKALSAMREQSGERNAANDREFNGRAKV